MWYLHCEPWLDNKMCYIFVTATMSYFSHSFKQSQGMLHHVSIFGYRISLQGKFQIIVLHRWQTTHCHTVGLLLMPHLGVTRVLFPFVWKETWNWQQTVLLIHHDNITPLKSETVAEHNIAKPVTKTLSNLFHAIFRLWWKKPCNCNIQFRI